MSKELPDTSDAFVSQLGTRTDDQVLLQRVAEGDAEALGLLYDRYGRLVFNVALRVTGDYGEAEEITQDTFLRLWERAAQYQPARGNLVAWLRTIAQRRSIDELRSRRGSSKRREVQLDEAQLLASAIDHTALMQLSIDLQQALVQLPAAQREVIELTALAGLSRQEAARRTASPPATIHTRWRVGIQRLRTILRGEEQAHAVSSSGIENRLL